jgi:hypothetical protein
METAITVSKQLTEDFEGIKWTTLACGKEASRFNLDMIFSLGRHVFATDGHRLHAYKPLHVTIPKGAYTFTMDKKQIILVPGDAKMPDVMQVFPWKRKILAKPQIHNGKGNVSYTYTTLVRTADPSVTYELKYIEDLIRGTESGYFRYYGPEVPLWMKNGRREGLVMAMRF